MTDLQKRENKIATAVNMTTEEVAVIKATVAKNTSDTELSFFLMTAQMTGLNPFLKEIWCYKDNKGNLLVFAGRDGFLKVAQRDPLWNGMVSSEVRENDEFHMQPTKGEIHHKFSPKDRGKIVGAYCFIRPKGEDTPTVVWVDLATYDKQQFVWKSHTADMIKKVAEIHALKKAFGISGIQSEHEFAIKGEYVEPINTPQIESSEQKENRRIEDFIEKAKNKKQLEEVEPYLQEQHKEKYEQKKLEL